MLSIRVSGTRSAVVAAGALALTALAGCNLTPEQVAALSAAGAAMRDSPSTPGVSAAPRSGLSCFATGDRVSGLNRICAYDCGGSAAAITVGAGQACPVTISR